MLHCRFDLYFLCNRVVFHGVGARFRVQVRGGGGGVIENSFRELVLSFHQVGTTNTQVVELGDQCLPPPP